MWLFMKKIWKSICYLLIINLLNNFHHAREHVYINKQLKIIEYCYGPNVNEGQTNLLLVKCVHNNKFIPSLKIIYASKAGFPLPVIV